MFAARNVGGSEVPRGESTYDIPGTYTWVCPAGVTSVSVVCVGGGGSGYVAGAQSGGLSKITVGATVVQANGGAASSGYSNAGGTASGGDANYTGGIGAYGGGGAAGYSGNGGAGGAAYSAGTSGTGGAGGGGGAPNGAAGGGGVGLFGEGASGAGGPASWVSTPYGGYGGSGGQNGVYGVAGDFGGGGGGGGAASYSGGGGGGLAYKNNISVTPGASYTVVVGAGGRTTQVSGANNGAGGNGAVRIVWPGTTRQFPSTDVGTP